MSEVASNISTGQRLPSPHGDGEGQVYTTVPTVSGSFESVDIASHHIDNSIFLYSPLASGQTDIAYQELPTGTDWSQS
jgi:hypothetical protein